jgi:uncharacterized protein YbaA (DUF1428 family)
MSNYIDGFVFPLSKKHLEAYKKVAQEVAQIWLAHGALSYREYTNEESSIEGCLNFPDTLQIKEGEVVVFGWVSFKDKISRDEVFKKVANDSRMHELVAPLLKPEAAIFEANRMVYGSFTPLIQEER